MYICKYNAIQAAKYVSAAALRSKRDKPLCGRRCIAAEPFRDVDRSQAITRISS
jgi:hypothetical protein